MAKKYGTGVLGGGTGLASVAISGATKPAVTVPYTSSKWAILGAGSLPLPTALQPTQQATQPTPQETAPAPAQQTPSMSYLDILSAYEAKARANYEAQQRELAKQLAASKASTSSNYDSAAAGNYVNYIKQQNALGEQLAAQGIRGGASESALARIGNNYALNQGSTNASRYGALAQLQSAYDTNIANLRSAMEDRILDTGLSLKQAQLQYEDTLAQREYERKIREEDVARAERERAEDIAREQQNRAEDIARDEKWKQLEWNKTLRDQKLEQYAAGTEQYVTMSDIKKINNVIAKIKTDKNWKKNKFKYGQVKALQARIGWIKQYNDNK